MPQMIYILYEMDWDDCWLNAITSSTDRGLMEELCLAFFQEQDYEDYLEDVLYYGFSDKVIHLRPADCNYFIMEVPIYGSEKLSES